jgi:hypothetical protein
VSQVCIQEYECNKVKTNKQNAKKRVRVNSQTGIQSRRRRASVFINAVKKLEKFYVVCSGRQQSKRTKTCLVFFFCSSFPFFVPGAHSKESCKHLFGASLEHVDTTGGVPNTPYRSTRTGKRLAIIWRYGTTRRGRRCQR